MGLSSIISPSDCTAIAPSLSSFSGTLANLVSAACAVADAYVGRNLATQAATEYYDGSLTVYLNLKRWPVTTMTEVKRDLSGGYGQITSSFGSDTILVQGTDYILDSNRGILQLIRTLSSGGDWFARGYSPPWNASNYGRGLVASYVPASWGQVLGSVKVTYTAGYATAPADLITAVAQIASYMATINDTGGLSVTSTSYIDTSEGKSQKQAVEELRGGIPALGTSRMILDSYRSPVVGTGWVL